MNFIVAGLGSMGRRRIRLLQRLDPHGKIIGVDTSDERQMEAQKAYGIATEASIRAALSSFKADAAVISASPLQHARLIEECLSSDLHVFTELNLVSDLYQENIELARSRGKVLFISSTFLYRDEISYIRKRVKDCAAPLNYFYHIGQYLPDWHPWESYKNYFVADKSTNACREILAIEIPWLRKTFGEINAFNAIKKKSSSLDIDYPDTYHMTLCHDSGAVGSLVVDVVSRKAVRNLEVYGEELYLSWDGSPAGLSEYDYDKKEDRSIRLYQEVDTLDGYSSFVVENAYQNELRCFLDEIKRAENVEKDTADGNAPAWTWGGARIYLCRRPCYIGAA